MTAIFLQGKPEEVNSVLAQFRAGTVPATVPEEKQPEKQEAEKKEDSENDATARRFSEIMQKAKTDGNVKEFVKTAAVKLGLSTLRGISPEKLRELVELCEEV